MWDYAHLAYIKIRTSYDCKGGAALPMTAPVQGDYDGGVKLLEV